MENISSQRKRKMVWVDGNTLVRVVGEEEAREYLHGNGYQSKLTAFIKERDRKLQEEVNLKSQKKQAKVISQEIEPVI